MKQSVKKIINWRGSGVSWTEISERLGYRNEYQSLWTFNIWANRERSWPTRLGIYPQSTY
jgi:hypothetical protein